MHENENQNSNYAGVVWKKANKKWQAQLQHNKKKHFGGYYDTQENAAMGVNLLCDKLGITRKHPTINKNRDEIQQVICIHYLWKGFFITYSCVSKYKIIYVTKVR